MATDRLVIALDRSVRRIDADGRMHVEICNISKAQVSEYYGREIPGADELGLDPNQIYPILRGPEALAKAVPTFNNLPLMDEHIIVSADQPQKERIVGSTGTDAEFNGEYLRNSLVIWDADMIARIESGEQKEISCAYRYVVDKMSGIYKALTHSLSMSSITGNHVALVPKGRAGPDVVVGDSEPGHAMPKRLTSKKALFAQGGIAATLAPLIAADAKPDIIGALQGVNRTNFKAMKATVAERLSKDKSVTADALSAVKIALDAMEREDCGEDDEMPEDANPHLTPGEDEETEEEERRKAKDKAARDKKARDAMSEDERRAADAEEERKKAEDRAKDEEKKRAEDKKAMDAALSKVRTDTIAEMNAIAAAKVDVMPLAGEIVAAMDSAADVYRFALDAAGIELDGTEPLSALKTMVKMATERSAPPVIIANDAKPGQGITDMFPGLRRLR